MSLVQPYYIEPRADGTHIALDGNWSFAWADTEQESFAKDFWHYDTTLPKSLYWSLFVAGILPDPYEGTNSKEYHWVDEKIWYYKKTFVLSKEAEGKRAFLSFDGVAYYSRLWVNGVLLGDHEGMFGGPACEVTELLSFVDENEIIVEVKACNFGCKDGYLGKHYDGTKKEIVPWNIARDTQTSNGDMIVIGIWNHVRLELLDAYHISRPYLYTESIGENEAKLHLEMEIADGSLSELHAYYGYAENSYSYTRAYDSGITGAVKEQTVRIVTEIRESDTGKTVFRSEDEESILDYKKLCMDARYHEIQYVKKDIVIEKPRLWYPHGMGEPYLYDVRISLYDGDRLCDTQSFKSGIRTFTAAPTAGRKYRHRTENFLFSINGKEIFIKGMNWMPIDFLYGISEDEYEWCLRLAKNAGIQLLRVWNGGGFPETDCFYRLCDELGLMVWQDLMLSNTAHTEAFPQKVLESQIAYNLYRIRNHASLVLLCGGNEFNPYAEGNAAAMFVQTRVCHDLAPHLIYHYTTADKGSAHIYRDMEPVWYRHIYKELPFLAESGIHSFPSYATWKKLIPKEELEGELPDLLSADFAQKCPSMLNHFTEYVPSRVPRMLSRASQIVNLRGVRLQELCEASQVQAYEYYTLMLQAMRENFPYCGGVMPWVFKRSWATVGIQVVDGLGQPSIPYYAIQNGYRPMQILWQMPWSVIAPKESLALDFLVLNDLQEDLDGCRMRLTLYRPDMMPEKEMSYELSEGETRHSFGVFTPNESYTDRCFLVSAQLLHAETLLAETTYFIKCTSLLSDADTYRKYRTAPTENLYFENGPWLKDGIESARKTTLHASLVGQGFEGAYTYYDVEIENVGAIAAYPVTLHLKEDASRHFESDSFFLLRPHEKRTVRIVTDDSGMAEGGDIEICAWNAEKAVCK